MCWKYFQLEVHPGLIVVVSNSLLIMNSFFFFTAKPCTDICLIHIDVCLPNFVHIKFKYRIFFFFFPLLEVLIYTYWWVVNSPLYLPLRTKRENVI